MSTCGARNEHGHVCDRAADHLQHEPYGFHAQDLDGNPDDGPMRVEQCKTENACRWRDLEPVFVAGARHPVGFRINGVLEPELQGRPDLIAMAG